MNTATEQQKDVLQDFLENRDKQGSFKREPIKDTVFTKATNEVGSLYLMGDKIIAKANNKEEENEIENDLKELKTKLLIPIIAAVIQVMEAEKEVKRLTELATKKQKN